MLQRLHHLQLAMPADSEPRARERAQASRGGGWLERGELRMHPGALQTSGHVG